MKVSSLHLSGPVLLRNESPFLRDEAIIVSTHKRRCTGTVSGIILQGELIVYTIRRLIQNFHACTQTFAYIQCRVFIFQEE
ncbi:unnamed protein product [Lasius platythorax]|uniref:Uncharacterized protein n=1 Tax=Lasius platythorax TaxID=488582 RepID=A0AAV2NNN4_9HYME